MPQRRTSPQLKLLLGVDPNERTRDDRPAPSRREPIAPGDLSEYEQKLWRQVTDELREMNQLSAADTHEITAYVRTVALAEQIHAELVGASLSALNIDTGVRHAHPLIVAYDRAVGRAHGLASGLGLNPHGRSLIHGRTALGDVGVDRSEVGVPDLYGA